MSRVLRVQPAEYVDQIVNGQELTKQPYPYFVEEDGSVQRQDFWQGSVARVVGFQRDLAVQSIDLWWSAAWASDLPCLTGMYLVTEDADGQWSTHQTAVESVTEVDPGRTGRPSDDGDATGGDPQINAENAAEYGGEE